jgi:hypothetical protein
LSTDRALHGHIYKRTAIFPYTDIQKNKKGKKKKKRELLFFFHAFFFKVSHWIR